MLLLQVPDTGGMAIKRFFLKEVLNGLKWRDLMFKKMLLKTKLKTRLQHRTAELIVESDMMQKWMILESLSGFSNSSTVITENW